MFLEILEFIFSSFWIWAGTAVLLTIALHGVSYILYRIVLIITCMVPSAKSKVVKEEDKEE